MKFFPLTLGTNPTEFHACPAKAPAFFFSLKDFYLALAGVAQWIEGGPVNQKVAGSIPSQGTCLGCRPGLQQEMHKRQPHIDVSLPLAKSK